MIETREYQIKAKQKILDWTTENDCSRVNTLVSVMASGKTVISCSAIISQILSGKRVWIIVNRVELLDQWHSELLKVDPEFDKRQIGFIAAGKSASYYRSLQFVQVQTLQHRLKKIPDHLKPDIVYLDESHETAFQRIVSEMRNRWAFKQINLTATPVRHGSSKVQYLDLFPKADWYQAATARQLIDAGRWKTPHWIIASEELSLKTSQRFSGMKVSGGEYDDTAQASVMIDLLPDHIAEWKSNGGEKHSCVWFCVNVKHSTVTCEALKAIGRNAAIVTGTSTPLDRKEAIRQFKSGKITDLVNCQCLTTGFDAPIASCAVWLRRTMSVGLFCQMAGRVLRKFDGVDIGLLMDLAGNLALHPFPELIDWFDFNPCKRLFRDPAMVMCRHCGYRHDSIPTPLHPSGDKKIKFIVGTGEFTDGLQLPLEHELKCHNCKAPVFADEEKLSAYGLWLKSVSSAVMAKEKPKRFEGHSAGISIGLAERLEEIPLTIEMMYLYGVWKFAGDEPSGKIPNKDRSEEYNKLRSKLIKNLEGRELRNLKLSLLNDKQQSYVNAFTVNEIESIESNEDRYRTSIVYAYLNNKPPHWCFNYWNDIIPPDRSEVIKALDSIIQDKSQVFELVRDWITEHLEKLEDQKRKGVCRKFLRCLATIECS